MCSAACSARGSRSRSDGLVLLASLALLVLASSRAAAESLCFRRFRSHAEVPPLQYEELDLPPHAVQAALVGSDHPAVDLGGGIGPEEDEPRVVRLLGLERKVDGILPVCA